ncbi:MAG: Lrp/AsnC family transcriptional regulator [Marinobacterium sp.]|nr:Lrp/AsnC family transcriptional regulator [Marinobacterium sp.]
MDRFDKAILNSLTENARQPVATIANAIGLSRTAVNDRIRKLEERGIIDRYTLERGDQTQAAVCAWFELTFRPFEQTKVKQAIRQIAGIRKAHALSGSIDLMLYVEVASMTELNHIRQQLDQLEHLDKLVTHTVLEQLI